MGVLKRSDSITRPRCAGSLQQLPTKDNSEEPSFLLLNKAESEWDTYLVVVPNQNNNTYTNEWHIGWVIGRTRSKRTPVLHTLLQGEQNQWTNQGKRIKVFGKAENFRWWFPIGKLGKGRREELEGIAKMTKVPKQDGVRHPSQCWVMEVLKQGALAGHLYDRAIAKAIAGDVVVPTSSQAVFAEALSTTAEAVDGDVVMSSSCQEVLAEALSTSSQDSTPNFAMLLALADVVISAAVDDAMQKRKFFNRPRASDFF